MARKSKKTTDLEAQAISIVRGEKQRWETATAFITDRVSFKMRQLIRVLRKNYYGIFDQPIDPNTGMEKVWYPLTEINVEAVVKNIDLDTKDITFRAKSPDGYGITDLTRAYVRDSLDKLGFGEMLDKLERDLAIDGTAVWKTFEENGELRVWPVDLLNVFIDPTTPSIQQAYRFTERALMFPEEMKNMSGWWNLEGIAKNVPAGLPRTDPYYGNNAGGVTSNTKAIDVYELWGKIPKNLITGLKADEDEEVEGHIVVSGIDSPGNERCHLIEENKKQDSKGNFLKPYEECWYTRVPGRWYGRGVAEKLLMLQVYANIILNVRINRSRISQMGIFKMRKNAGITPQMIGRLMSNGVVPLQNMDDLEQFVVQDVSQSSYNDENVINALSERLTNAFDVVTGEALPSSTPATNAAIQNQNAKSGFAIIKDGLGRFLERWLDYHALPILAKNLNKAKIVRFSKDDDAFNSIVETVLTTKAIEALEQHHAAGYLPDPMEFQMELDSARDRLLKSDLFVDLVEDVVADQLETELQVTNEEMDVPMTVQNLINLSQITPQYAESNAKQIYDLLGLGQPKAAAPMMAPSMGAPIQQTMQQQATAANVPQV